MNAYGGVTRACVMGALVFCTGAFAADEDLRHTVSINDHTPTVQEVEEALFPKQMESQKEECGAIEKAGFRCQSVIPKSSLDSVQITFSRGSAKLTSEAKDFLRSVGEALQRRVSTWKSLVIEGHTDATGTDAINRKLSAQRADTVRQFLQAQYGLKNIEVEGRSSDRLKDPQNPTSELNRRVEFIPNW
jgi:outer membrane protein OmpA-like peptidoglycan-associated protein